MSRENSSDSIFYKYLSVSRGKKLDKRKLDMLKNNQLWFSSPSCFNDLFDSQIDVVLKATKAELIDFYIDLVGYRVTDNEIDNYISENLEKLDDGNYLKKPSEASMNDFRDNFKILSLTKKNNNDVMWSHYADNNKGICLCLKAVQHPDFFAINFDSELLELYEMKYSDAVPEPIHYFNAKMDDLRNCLLTKKLNWVYEEEYRLIDFQYNSSKKKGILKTFDKSSLVGIIFGLNTPHNHILEIYKCIKKYFLDEGFDVHFYKCEKYQGDRTLLPIKIEIEHYLK
ncbi:DUF2971 domain-containing protein [Methanolobus sediminis]|uniref:DUF2971 domain-containing protein n=1 Tax=Methanolobus sediminis TaxID=3072978 RepID=A0AA51UKH6_9EURY|nr:DUF2971 domain-containing protein [Methanolobus sediminis]WMW25222.1 DUF2971 domain-containing protein [Methanolobus sediminis]